MKMV